MQRDHIHVAFGDDDPVPAGIAVAADIRPGRRPAVEHAAFFEHRRIGRIEVFRLVVPHSAGAEGDDPSGAVADREHHPVGEIIVRAAAAVGGVQQPGFDEERLGKFLPERAV